MVEAKELERNVTHCNYSFIPQPHVCARARSRCCLTRFDLLRVGFFLRYLVTNF